MNEINNGNRSKGMNEKRNSGRISRGRERQVSENGGNGGKRRKRRSRDTSLESRRLDRMQRKFNQMTQDLPPEDAEFVGYNMNLSEDEMERAGYYNNFSSDGASETEPEGVNQQQNPKRKNNFSSDGTYNNLSSDEDADSDDM